jgi:putative transposase
MYARGMTTHEIQGHLEEIYGMEVSADLISDVTEAVMEEVESWQKRPLESHYPIVYMDAIRVKIRDGGMIQNKSIYLIIGVDMDGQKDVLGLWVSVDEGAKFWLKILTELKNRGVEDIFIACIDGLKGFPEAIASVFPKTKVQLCIVHVLRSSLNYVPWKDRKAAAADLKKIYTAVNEEDALKALSEFESRWGEKYAMIVECWARNWSHIIPFLDYPPNIRRAIYTTNAIESANRSLRKTLKVCSVFPNDKAAIKLIYLSLQQIKKRWIMPIREWKQALNQFAIEFNDRFPQGRI